MRKTFIIVFCLWLFGLFPIHSSASVSVPYKTETLSADGNVIETLTAYVPIGVVDSNVNISNPEDIFIDDDGYIYVADSSAQSVTKLDSTGNVELIFGEDILEQPLGVFVDHDKDVYIADYAEEKVFRFDRSGNLIDEFGRPDSPLFGMNSPYKPQKVAVDQRKNIYIIGESSTNGIIQLNQDGTFLGFYGANHSRQTLLNFFQDLITTQRQKANLFMSVPPAPTNIDIDDQGLVHTVTSGTGFEVIRKLNIAGSNMLPPEVSAENNLRDIAIGPIGNIYTIGNDGKIYEYDRFGNLLFIFGGRDDGTSRNGLLRQPTSIEVDNLGRLYITDREQGNIQIYEPTQFTTKLHQALTLYAEGFYIESQENWEEILNLNSSFGLAHTAMGQAYFKQQLYEDALEEFKLAENKPGYSDAFWEIRHRWMQNNLGTIFTVLIGLYFLNIVVKQLDKRRNILQPIRDIWKKVKEQKLISELLYLFRFFKHPIDCFYYLKENEKVSVISATILYFILFVEYVFMLYQTGFLFLNHNISELNIFLELATLFVPILLFIVANYLVSTINDGEGSFRQIYIGTIYSLAPVIVGLVPITIISNFLTFNEEFIYSFTMVAVISWSLIILYLMIQEIHDYTFFETIRNILVTIFTMLIMVLVFFIIYVLLDQVYDFVYTLIQEVILRV